MKQETLKSIQANFQDDEACLKAMLLAWFQIVDPQSAQEKLLAVLEKPDIGYSELVKQLRDAFKQPTGQYTELNNVTNLCIAPQDCLEGPSCSD